MIDLDGSSSFSKTIAINFEQNGSYLTLENPAKNGEFMLKTNYLNPNFSMVNSVGSKIEIASIKHGANLYKIKSKNATTGLCFLIVESKDKVLITKVLIE